MVLDFIDYFVDLSGQRAEIKIVFPRTIQVIPLTTVFPPDFYEID